MEEPKEIINDFSKFLIEDYKKEFEIFEKFIKTERAKPPEENKEVFAILENYIENKIVPVTKEYAQNLVPNKIGVFDKFGFFFEFCMGNPPNYNFFKEAVVTDTNIIEYSKCYRIYMPTFICPGEQLVKIYEPRPNKF